MPKTPPQQNGSGVAFFWFVLLIVILFTVAWNSVGK